MATPRVFTSAVLVATELKVLPDLMELLALAKTATNYFSTAAIVGLNFETTYLQISGIYLIRPGSYQTQRIRR